MADVISHRSGGNSGRYRIRSNRAEIDENLFGNRAKKGSELRLPPSAVIMTESELSRIRTRSILKSEAEIQKEKEANDKILQEKKAQAKARKEKMLQLAEEAKKKTKKTDIEIENQARDETIRALAQEKLNMELDLVKHLRALAAQAEAFTVRDRQLKEKDGVIIKEKEYNQRMDELMERARVEDIQRREAEEARKLEQRVKDREVIVSQIKAREQRKIIEEEAREQEGLAMLALLKKYEEEDRKAQVKKAQEISRIKLEIMAANEKAIEARKDAKQKEKDEVQAIIEYQIKKDAELRKREEEELAREAAKKQRQAELLAQQERAQNNQAELDELRARRAAEEKERAARQREKEEAEKRKRDVIFLKEERMKQAEYRKAMLAKEAATQQMEYEHAVKYNAAILERERKEEERKKFANQDHLQYLKQQVVDAEERRVKSRQIKFDEGKKLKQEYAAERAKLETIRDHMVREMEKKGTNPRYLSEMKRVSIEKLQMR